MDPEQSDYQRQRETSLAVMLAVLGFGGFLFFMALVTGGFCLWVYLITAAMAAFAWINYLLWGRRMTEATAGEREEEELRARLEDGDWADDDPRQPRHD